MMTLDQLREANALVSRVAAFRKAVAGQGYVFVETKLHVLGLEEELRALGVDPGPFEWPPHVTPPPAPLAPPVALVRAA